MSVRSMTGFARVRKEIAEGEIVLTLKTVNHRGLDIHFHLPLELDAVENEIRAVVRNGVARGHLQIHIGFTRASAALAPPLNRAMLHAYMRAFQEASLLADRSDIAEELMRLRTHAGQLEAMLSAGGEAGKRLDFLLQEMNRESNTVLSKTGGLGDLGLTITDLALAAKSEIDKIREQALNLE